MIVIFYLSLCSPSFIQVKRRVSKEHANSVFRISAIQEEMTLVTYTLKKEAEISSEKSVNDYHQIWCYIPDNVTPYHDGCYNLKFAFISLISVRICERLIQILGHTICSNFQTVLNENIRHVLENTGPNQITLLMHKNSREL